MAKKLALTLLLQTGLICSVTTSPVSKRQAGSCTDLSFSFPATAENVVFPSSYNTSALDLEYLQNLTSFPRASVSHDYTITATYCEPTSGPESRRSTLQLLLHGITYDKSYWVGKNINGTAYSWVDYALSQGYPTLAIDRICNGGSSTPNGLLVCQLPTNAAVVHEIVQRARTTGQVVSGRAAFSKVVVVSHSEGSVVANFHSQVYPQDADAYLLTGFTNRLLVGSAGDFLAIKPLPAALVDPGRFGYLAGDPTYQVATDTAGAEGLFYFGAYSQQLVDSEFATRGAFPLGEFLTAPLGQLPAQQYTGKVFVLNGQQDQVFCAVSPLDPVIGGRGDCGSGTSSLSAQTQSLYPSASVYRWTQIPNTGHNVDFHFTAMQTFQESHDFLAIEGF